jgi:hypothetical protein
LIVDPCRRNAFEFDDNRYLPYMPGRHFRVGSERRTAVALSIERTETRSMKRLLLASIAVVWAATAHATTYNYTGKPYSTTTVFNFTPPCSVGPCADYTGDMRIRGSFSTLTPLPANLPGSTDISALVTAFSFTDGINSYVSTDPNVRIRAFHVATDDRGNIIMDGGQTFIDLQLWQTGTAPHVMNDRLATLVIGGMSDQAGNNWSCTSVPGLGDICPLSNRDSAGSLAGGSPDFIGVWRVGSVQAPAVSPRGMLLLFALLLATGLYGVHRNRLA